MKSKAVGTRSVRTSPNESDENSMEVFPDSIEVHIVYYLAVVHT